jgi:chromosome segregation ATPase
MDEITQTQMVEMLKGAFSAIVTQGKDFSDEKGKNARECDLRESMNATLVALQHEVSRLSAEQYKHENALNEERKEREAEVAKLQAEVDEEREKREALEAKVNKEREKREALEAQVDEERKKREAEVARLQAEVDVHFAEQYQLEIALDEERKEREALETSSRRTNLLLQFLMQKVKDPNGIIQVPLRQNGKKVECSVSDCHLRLYSNGLHLYLVVGERYISTDDPEIDMLMPSRIQ